MKVLTYQIRFFTYWHVSSGLSGGVDAQTALLKTPEGLPMIPGKTLKGLLRDAAESLSELGASGLDKPFIEQVFGEENQNTYDRQSCFFSNAELPVGLNLEEGQKSLLYDRLASTSMDERGLAKDQTLRQLEVCVPLSLQASIQDFPLTEGYEHAMETCMKWVKQLGLNRHRGLGRCQFTNLAWKTT